MRLRQLKHAKMVAGVRYYAFNDQSSKLGHLWHWRQEIGHKIPEGIFTDAVLSESATSGAICRASGKTKAHRRLASRHYLVVKCG